jgi:predicted dehydrogenase
LDSTTRRGFLIAGSVARLVGQSTVEQHLQSGHASASKPLRIAFIGGGHRAWLLISIIRTLPDVEIVAIADPTPEFIDRAAALAGPAVKKYAGYELLFGDNNELDAVVVVTPGALHAEGAIAALDHGLHVFCEKPMATTIEAANLMIAAAERSGRILHIDHQMRLDPVYAKLHALAADGSIGEVRLISGYLYRGDWNPKSWHVPDPRTGRPTVWRELQHWTGSSLIEDGIHELDVLHWIAGAKVTRVYATGGKLVYRDRETIDHAGVLIDYESGVKLQFGYSLFALGRQEEVQLIGAQGSLRTDNGRIQLLRKGLEAQWIDAWGNGARTGPNPAGTLENPANLRSVQAFLSNVRENRKPETGGQVGKEAIKIGLLAQLSIDERRPVDWGDLPA